MGKRKAQNTVVFKNPVTIVSSFSVAGKLEKQGPFGSVFDITFEDDLWGEKTYELTERKMITAAAASAIERANLKPGDMHYFLGGDLLNQIISAGFCARDLDIPFFGLYGACSTMAESIALGSMIVDGGFADKLLCATSSHFATAERQFRFPLELGTPKTPTSQNTVSAAGAVVLSSSAPVNDPVVTSATVGRVVDFGLKDTNDMGSAMAPAAAQTIITHLEDMGRDADYYDYIVTGDLGIFGSQMLLELCCEQNKPLSNHQDCGALIYGGNELMHCGGSGCGCCASMLCGHFLKQMYTGNINRILVVATGSLHSPTSTLQGETIPAIAHAVSIERSAL